MDEDEEENGTEEEVKEEVMVEMVDITDEDKEDECNDKIIQEIKTCFIEHQHCMALR